MELDTLTPKLRKKAVNATVREDILQEAKAFNVNISQVLETALASHNKRLREAKWLKENQAAIEEYNNWYAKHGDVFENLRQKAWAVYNPATQEVSP